MNPYTDHAAGLGDLQAELGDNCPVFTWNGANYRILPASVRYGKPMDIGGFKTEADLAFVVLTNAFPGYASAEAVKDALLQKQIAYRGKTYNVTNVIIPPTGQQMRVEADADRAR